MNNFSWRVKICMRLSIFVLMKKNAGDDMQDSTDRKGARALEVDGWSIRLPAFSFFLFSPSFLLVTLGSWTIHAETGYVTGHHLWQLKKKERETTKRKGKNCISSADSSFWRTLKSQWHGLAPSIYPSRIRYRGNKRWEIDEYSRKSFASTPHDRDWRILLTNPRFPLLRFHRETHCFSLRAWHGCLFYHLPMNTISNKRCSLGSGFLNFEKVQRILLDRPRTVTEVPRLTVRHFSPRFFANFANN